MSPLQTEKMNVPVDNSPVRNAEKPADIVQDGSAKIQQDNVTVAMESAPPKQRSIEEMERDLAEAKAKRLKLKGVISQALDRGMVAQRVHVDLPPEVYGEWVRNDPFEIDRLKGIGFKIDDKYAVDRALHGDAAGNPVVGDVIFMTCPKEVKEVIDEIRADHARDKHGPRKKQQEEQNFEALTRKDTGGVVPVDIRSSATQIGKHEIAAAIGMDKLNQP